MYLWDLKSQFIHVWFAQLYAYLDLSYKPWNTQEVEVYAVINLISHDLISHSAFNPNEAAGNNTKYI